MPRFWQHTNKNGMATHILLVQGIIVSFLAVTFVVLPSVEAAYQILSQLAAVIYLILYMLMFSSAIYLRFSQPNRPRPYNVPGGKTGLYIIAGVGFTASLTAFAFSFIPPSQIAVGSPTVFISILVGLSAVFITIPLVIYAIRKPHWREENSDFAPFTWQIEGVHPGVQNHSDLHTESVTANHKENQGAQ